MNGALSRVRLIVFDLDGTLVDSLQDLTESANDLLAEHGGSAIPDEAIKTMVGEGAATLVARVFEAAKLVQPAGALPRFLALYNGRLLRHTRPYPGVLETLDALITSRRLALLTNKPLGATQTILQGLDLSRYFADDAVLGGDGPLPRKPDPSGLVHLASMAGVRPEETLMVGDSAIDWQTARAAGSRACLVTYGFGFHKVPRREVRDDELVVDDLRELPAFL